MTLRCVGLTQSSVIQIIHRNVGLKCFFFHLPKFLLLSSVFVYMYILQRSVEVHLPCGGIYNNCIIANCLQSMPVKDFENWLMISEDIDESEVLRFLWPTVYVGRCWSVQGVVSAAEPAHGCSAGVHLCGPARSVSQCGVDRSWHTLRVMWTAEGCACLLSQCCRHGKMYIASGICGFSFAL